MIPTYKSFSTRIQLILFSSWISFHNCSFEAQMDSTEINSLFITFQINCFYLKSSHINCFLVPKSDLNLNNLSLIYIFIYYQQDKDFHWFDSLIIYSWISFHFHIVECHSRSIVLIWSHTMSNVFWLPRVIWIWTTYHWFIHSYYQQYQEFHWFDSFLEYHFTFISLSNL